MVDHHLGQPRVHQRSQHHARFHENCWRCGLRNHRDNLGSVSRVALAFSGCQKTTSQHPGAESQLATPLRTLEPVFCLLPPRSHVNCCSVEAVVLPKYTVECSTIHISVCTSGSADNKVTKRIFLLLRNDCNARYKWRAHAHVLGELRCWPEVVRILMSHFQRDIGPESGAVRRMT